MTSQTRRVEGCEVCGDPHLVPSLNLGSYPLCDELQPSALSAEVPCYPQLIGLCSRCLTAHQMLQVPKERLFPAAYHYRSSLTKDVVDGCQQLAEQAVSRSSQDGAERRTVVDIGCNDGTLLSFFKARGFVTVGVDPTNAIDEASSAIDIAFKEYFSLSTARSIVESVGYPDVVTMTNVFAHIEGLPSLLDALRLLIGPRTLLVIENHYLGDIIARSQFDTFYHEHPRTYSLLSFKHVAKNLDCVIVEYQRTPRYGGNVRVLLRSKESGSVGVELPDESEFREQFPDLQGRFERWRSLTRPKVLGLAQDGGVVGKALPGRAVMLMNALDLTQEVMPRVYERPSSPKVGHFVPNTGIEVVSDEQLADETAANLIIWAWHIAGEVAPYVREMGFRGKMWTVMPELAPLDE